LASSACWPPPPSGTRPSWLVPPEQPAMRQSANEGAKKDPNNHVLVFIVLDLVGEEVMNSHSLSKMMALMRAR
jgi:hypothetical protein